MTAFVNHAAERAERLDALQAVADTLPYDELATQLKALHLEERAEHNAEWMAIASDKAAHLREQRDAKVRAAEAKQRLREAERHVQEAQRLLAIATKEVEETDADVKATNARISALGKEIEDEYRQLSMYHPRPCYEYYVKWLKTHNPPPPAPPAAEEEPAEEPAAEATEDAPAATEGAEDAAAPEA